MTVETKPRVSLLLDDSMSLLVNLDLSFISLSWMLTSQTFLPSLPPLLSDKYILGHEIICSIGLIPPGDAPTFGCRKGDTAFKNDEIQVLCLKESVHVNHFVLEHLLYLILWSTLYILELEDDVNFDSVVLLSLHNHLPMEHDLLSLLACSELYP